MTNVFKKVERAISSLIPHEHSAQRRANMDAITSQMDLYNQQKDQLHAENERIAKEKNIERERLHAKQIRALRRSFRRPGFLNSATDSSAPSTTLG